MQELQKDPLGILRPASKLQHNLHLASAYAAVHEARDGGAAVQKQKRRMDPKYHEPKVRHDLPSQMCMSVYCAMERGVLWAPLGTLECTHFAL